ncbi:methionyl-tRNA formyltransferase [Candidatus Saccharibacteria bacterium]|nr:methionyl-tRNA formyltransferase [Candidatus Saccharibacteria bacterium]
MIEPVKKIVFFGNERLSSSPAYARAPIMEALLDAGFEIEALIIKNNETRSRKISRPAILDRAAAKDVNVVRVRTAGELRAAVGNLASKAAVLASFGMLLEGEIIERFPLGIVNVHPSLLPAHRGPTPIESAILSGDRETGVSLMKVVSELDAGDVYAQNRLVIEKDESKLSLTERLGDLAAEMIVENLTLILEQRLQPQPQNHDRATYSQSIKPAPALKFEQHSAEYLCRHMRAFAGCPNNKFDLDGQTVEITSAKPADRPAGAESLVYDRSDGLLYARCRQGYLAIESLRPLSRNDMTAADFVNGFSRQLLNHPGNA